MSNGSHCNVTIGSSFEDINLCSRIANISKSGIIRNVNIIAENDFRFDTSDFRYEEISNFEDLSNIIRGIIKNNVMGNIYFEANTTLVDFNSDDIYYNSFKGTLVLNLTQSTYRSIPNLSRIGDVKRIKESKVGHGAKNMSSYKYQIRINLTKFDDIPEELDYVISTKFKCCKLVIALNGVDSTFLPQIKADIKFLNLPLDPNLMELSTSDISLEGNILELFEYLTLLHLNSPLLLEQENTLMDSITAHDDVEGVRSPQMGRYHIRYFISSFIPILLKKNWKSISLYCTNSHIIIYKSQKEGKIIILESK